MQDLKIGNKRYEEINNFKHFRNIIDNKNKIKSICVERIQAGNTTYFPNIRILRNKILMRASKIQIYRILI